MTNTSLLELTDSGLYCKKGDFYIDPFKPVKKAIITHAHSDHARFGSSNYLAVNESALLLKRRLGEDIKLETLSYEENININQVKISFHPAGHILGSSQIRLEYKGEVWVVSGDYKVEKDITCKSFNPIKCNVFISEATFGLPIYKWKDTNLVADEINSWWQKNQENNIASVIFAYSLGKAQRVLANIDYSIGEIFTHQAVENINEAYRENHIKLPITKNIYQNKDKTIFSKSLIIAPPGANTSNWLKQFGQYSTAFASGWMLTRAARRQRGTDRGFILSDHADWNGLINSIRETEAEKVYVTHGKTYSIAKYLNEIGINTSPLENEYLKSISENDDE